VTGLRALFVHQSFPGQYRHLAPALAARPGEEVVALGERHLAELPGVRAHGYRAPAGAGAGTHRYVRPLEAAVRRGQQVARAATALKRRGFAPDIVLCHPGWGEGLFLRDVFPDARFLFCFEYHYGAAGADVGFGEEGPVPLDEAARVRVLNANNLLSLEAADWGHTATHWQRSRFPDWARPRISVVHEGVDTALFRPDAGARFALPDGRVLSRAEEVVTFVARGLEPYRGFPSFMRALPELLQQRPRAQVVVVGEDACFYGGPPPGGGTWGDALRAELDGRLDLSRVHVVGRVPHAALRSLFQVSAAHVYLSYPFVLSWSLLEAMACGCAVVGSATAPVEEVVTDGHDGRLVPFHAPEAIAAAVAGLLADQEAARALGAAARARVVRDYDLRSVCLPAGLALLDAVASGAAGSDAGPAAPVRTVGGRAA
jgi:glycosyltransferase involved in cell wall biosynthesis